MENKLRYLINVSYWIIYSFILLIILLASKIGQSATPHLDTLFGVITGFILIPSIAPFYGSYRYLFPHYTRNRNITSLISKGLFISVLCSVLGLMVTSFLFKNQFNLQNGTEVFIEKFVLTFLVSSLNIVTGFILKGFVSWYDNLRINEELEQKAKLTELALIESKLDPHFLFNTINNIDVLVTKNPETASVYLNKLSDILRFILYESKGRKIKIDQEIDYIKRYIQLQRIRTSNENFVTLKINGDSDNNILIHPMTFIPFVENAFKHSTNKKLENAIEIHLTFLNHHIHLECSNKFSPSFKPKEGGLGNELISRRLELLYPESHSLQTSKTTDTYTIKLDIEL